MRALLSRCRPLAACSRRQLSTVKYRSQDHAVDLSSFSCDKIR